MEDPIGSNWKFHHVAVAVKNMDKTRSKYASILGESIFRPETILDSSTFSVYDVHNQSASSVHKSRFNHTDIGPDKFDVEFISHTAPSLYVPFRAIIATIRESIPLLLALEIAAATPVGV